MSKKIAISITLGVVALVYIFLLVALPALVEALSLVYNSEAIATPIFMYIVPGLIGGSVIILIMKQTKKGAKENE